MSVEDGYIQWLHETIKTASPKSDISYFLLASALNKMEFYSLMDDDHNREEDGVDLRREYLHETGQDLTINHRFVYKGPCTVLEALIGIAKRINFDLYEDEQGDMTWLYFWELIENLGLDRFNDDSYIDMDGTVQVSKIVTTWLDRRYHRDGKGGIFPLKYGRKDVDMRKISIFEQKKLYLEERSR